MSPGIFAKKKEEEEWPELTEEEEEEEFKFIPRKIPPLRLDPSPFLHLLFLITQD